MKKIIILCCVAIILIGLAVFTLPAADQGVDTSAAVNDGGDSSSSGTAIYERQDFPCPDPLKEKTHCLADGNEQCTAKYCN